MKSLFFLMTCLAALPLFAEKAETPEFFYKVLSCENWHASQNKKKLVLSTMDKNFIHLAREDQLERIISKFWGDSDQYVVLKLATNKLRGRLVFETNPGGSSKYYHLHSGFIPMTAVEDSSVRTRQPLQPAIHPLVSQL